LNFEWRAREQGPIKPFVTARASESFKRENTTSKRALFLSFRAVKLAGWHKGGLLTPIVHCPVRREKRGRKTSLSMQNICISAAAHKKSTFFAVLSTGEKAEKKTKRIQGDKYFINFRRKACHHSRSAMGIIKSAEREASVLMCAFKADAVKYKPVYFLFYERAPSRGYKEHTRAH